MKASQRNRGNWAFSIVFTVFLLLRSPLDQEHHIFKMQLIHLILVASTAATYASAIAMPQPEVDLVARAKVPCDKIEKYTSAVCLRRVRCTEVGYLTNAL
jgi:hypothetical protein